MNKITFFRDECRFPSNFYQCPFEYKGLTCPNAEAAFQAQKCSNDKDRIKYTLQKIPWGQTNGKEGTYPQLEHCGMITAGEGVPVKNAASEKFKIGLRKF